MPQPSLRPCDALGRVPHNPNNPMHVIRHDHSPSAQGRAIGTIRRVAHPSQSLQRFDPSVKVRASRPNARQADARNRQWTMQRLPVVVTELLTDARGRMGLLAFVDLLWAGKSARHRERLTSVQDAREDGWVGE